jgi:hypothetical protein
MTAIMMFLDCPAFSDRDLTLRCGLPAEVRRRFTMPSTDGLLECATIRCPAGHHFNAPIEFLTWNGKGQGDPGATTADSRSVRDSQGSREGSTRSGHKPSPTADNPPYLGTPTPVTSSPSADVPNSSMRASASMWV